MTTTVVVKARAHGAIVNVVQKTDGNDTSSEEIRQKITIGPNQDQTFHIDQDTTISVEQGEPPVPTTAEEAEDQHAPSDPPVIGEPISNIEEDDEA